MTAPTMSEQRALGLWDSFRRSLETNAERPAIAFGDATHTYADLAAAVANAAARLAGHGVRDGGRVALLTEIGPAFPVHDLAVMALGAVKVPLNPQLTAGDVGDIVRRVDAAAVVVSPSLLPLTAEVDDALLLDDSLDWQAGAELPCPAALDPSEPAVVYFTGGTTGRPKGVVHSRSGTITNLLAHVLEGGVARDERLLLTTPLAHAAGLFTLTGLLRGAYVRLEPGFDAQHVIDVLDDDALTWTFAVPTMIYRLLDAAEARGWRPSSLRTIQYGGAPISAERLHQALERFGPVLQQLYAQTECPNFGAVLRKDDHVRALERPELLRSCGRASIMCDVSVRDEDGAALGAHEIGEICLRSPYTMSGYWDDPEAFAERFFGDWLRTGDLGRTDEEGNVYIVDRRADMIISGGMNVYCLEVEDVLLRFPGVTAAAVIGVPNDDWGEAVHAVVVGDVDPAALAAHARTALAAYKRPKTYDLVDALPLTTYGKVDRKALRAPFWQGRDRAVN